MNFYIRYFDKEALFSNLAQGVEFINKIQGFNLDDKIVADLADFLQGPVQFPKRYKMRNKSYFIVIKTKADSLEAFKANAVNVPRATPEPQPFTEPQPVADPYTAENVGWYQVQLNFNRVLANPATGKCGYFPTEFGARVKAFSVQNAFERVMEHLKGRQDVDPRSQFPSVKSKKTRIKYLGLGS